MTDFDDIKLTATAADYVKKIIAKKGGGIGIRLSTKAAGCSGLMYMVDIISESTEKDLRFPIDGQLSVYIDPECYPYLKGTQIDLVQKGLNQVFEYKNPNETGHCGCGESFIID